jgi:hypothetical protein
MEWVWLTIFVMVVLEVGIAIGKKIERKRWTGERGPDDVVRTETDNKEHTRIPRR